MQIEAQSAHPGPLRLRAPEVLQAIGARAVRQAVPLAPERQAELEGEAGRVLAALLAHEPEGGLAGCLDGALLPGRVRADVGLVEAGRLQRKFGDLEALPVFRALQGLRLELKARCTGAPAAARHWWDRLPWAARPLVDTQPAADAPQRLRDALATLDIACESVRTELAGLELTRASLWDAMQQLAGAIHFAQVLDERLRIKVDVLRASDAQRAGVLDADVLQPVRRDRQEMLAQQVLCTNCYFAIEVLKKTGQEVLAACAQIAALLQEGEGAQVQQALQALDAMEAFRAEAASAMAQNAAMLGELSSGRVLH